MKKIIYFLFFIGLSQSINALTIENLSIEPINSQDINVHVKSKDYYYFIYSDYQYSIQGDIITLSICYVPTLSSVISEMNNDFLLPNINIASNNYTLIVNLYYSNQGICNYNVIQDSASLQFNTPISQLITLSTNNISDINTVVFMSPNPTTGKVYYDNSNSQYTNIIVYNSIGQVVLTSFVAENYKMVVDLGELPDGMYMVKMSDNFGRNKTNKVIKKNSL